VKKVLPEDNLDEIKKAMETLTEAVYAATTKIYQKIQAEQAAQQQPGTGPDEAGSSPDQDKKDDDNVVNADYKVKEE
jgi:molecular chaperone DnaK